MVAEQPAETAHPAPSPLRRWCGCQRRIVLTGGIASGKSTVGQRLETRGLPVLDADAYAREALAPGTPGARAVLDRYGATVRLESEATEECEMRVM